jgi:hypothetical protein
MELTKELRERHLCVGLLCTVQDDTGSKQGAVGNIDRIYGQAYLTIIAAAGKDPNSGLPGFAYRGRGVSQAIEEIETGFEVVAFSYTVGILSESLVYFQGLGHKHPKEQMCNH